MASRKVSDVDLLRAVLELRDRDIPSTARNVASHLDMSPSSVHRRLQRLVDSGALAAGGTGFRLRPHALDLCGEFREGHLYWQLDGTGDLLIFST